MTTTNSRHSSHELEEQNYVVHASNLPDFKGLYHLHIYESKVSSLKRESLKIQRGKLQSLGMVTTALTHELNNPLTGIFELSKDLETHFEGQIAEDFSEVSKAAQRCLSIIENLKNFSSKKIDFERIQLSKVIQDALSLTKIMIRSVRLNCDLDKKIWISGSSTIISQAIFNIIKNSIEAMDYKGEINIKLFKEDEEAVIHFEDRGPGLPEDFNEIALFGTQKKTKGAGYGMFLVHEFVKLHGGLLSFGNNPDGKGAFFTMRFKLENRLEKKLEK
jgi:C4-dicarboxylate-specific signal transduction histidine kinase